MRPTDAEGAHKTWEMNLTPMCLVYVPYSIIVWHILKLMATPDPKSKHEARLGPQGRLVIPAHLRKALDLEPGDRVVVYQDGDSIVLERRDNLIKRLQDRFANVPGDVSLADELIAERGDEAAGEADD